MPHRLVSSCLALALLAGCGAAASSPVSPSTSGASAVRASAERPVVRALGQLRRWDERRAAAYAASDLGRLRRLYAPGSRAGARDVRILRSYADRGLIVEELAVQVLDVRLVSASPQSVRLRVLDRVAGGAVVPTSGRGEAMLPSGRPTLRTVTMVDLGDGWVVRSVRHG
jgi:hypothetical protein